MGAVENWQTPSWRAYGHLAMAGFFVTLGHYFIISAFRASRSPWVSPFRYSVVLFAVLYGSVVLRRTAGPPCSLGTLLIVASGL